MGGDVEGGAVSYYGSEIEGEIGRIVRYWRKVAWWNAVVFSGIGFLVGIVTATFLLVWLG